MTIFKTIFNPQGKFQENQLLILGVLCLLIGSFVGTFAQISYDGVFDVHLSKNVSFGDSIVENIINILCVFVPLFIFGKIINNKTRWIDILNASLLYRIPMFLSVPFAKLPVFEKISQLAVENQIDSFPFSVMDLVQITFASLFILLLLTYAIILLVNGFKTATNTKKWQHFVVFTLLLIVAEIISKLLITNI
ncbi:MAG: hypothetical protein CSA38_04230 [Flavobacteriales bacterium]|nr:MAG: hypothetical protein CSA38_04230 [Flavobacteriales bacterium]